MSISYSGLINYGAVTLPSVESWGTNMNILRDPPKSITTRRINKVGETSSITEMIDEAGDRSCEAISTYARGINPFVSVSYSNNGNNGGQRSGGLKAGGQTHAFLPYTVAKDGAFRPPVRRQEDLLPLSRMPRVWTTAFTQPGFVDFSKRMRNCGTAEETREVKNSILHTHVRPTAVYNIERPIEEPFEIKYTIQPSIKTVGNSGIRTMDRTTQNVQEPTKNVNRDMRHAFASSNKNQNRHVNNSDLYTDSFIQKTNPHAVNSNVGASHIQLTSIEDIFDLGAISTKDSTNINYQTQAIGQERNNFIYEDIELSRNVPEHVARTNIGKSVYKNVSGHFSREFQKNTPLTHMSINPGRKGEGDISSRERYLAPKIQPGGFSNAGVKPMKDRMQNVQEPYESEKSKMSRSVMEQFQGRYLN